MLTMSIILRNYVYEGEKGEILRLFLESFILICYINRICKKINWGGGVERLD
jgi:hypothetical protein